MGVGGVGNKGIGGEETGKGGIVNAAIHINKAKPVEVLVAGIAPVEKESSGYIGKTPVGRVAAAAPGIESQGFGLGADCSSEIIRFAITVHTAILTNFHYHAKGFARQQWGKLNFKA